jgi:hypothetical protein
MHRVDDVLVRPGRLGFVAVGKEELVRQKAVPGEL